MLEYKIDIVQALRDRGYNPARIRREHLLSEDTMTRLRTKNTKISTDTIGLICSMLRCQPNDILVNNITDEEKLKLF